MFYFRVQSVANKIYDAIRDLAKVSGDTDRLPMTEIKQYCINKGFTLDNIENTIRDYEELNVFQLVQAGSVLKFVQTQTQET